MVTGLGKRLQSDSKLRSGTGLTDPRGEFVTRRVDELHPHPSYARHHFTVPASKLSVLAERGGLAFREPLVITQDRAIVDGYARLELAKLTGRQTLPCIEYELTEPEALHLLLQRHVRSDGLNAFSRILLALELEPWLTERAVPRRYWRFFENSWVQIGGFGEMRSGPILTERGCATIGWKSNRENKTDSENPKEVLRTI